MSDTAAPSTPVQADPASPSPVTSLNAKTARRQKLLLGSLGALALVGGSWFILGGDDGAKSDDPTAAQTIDTAGLINRDLSQREFVATYGNRLDAVTREQKAMKDASLPREEIEAQLAALKAENQAMRTDGQSAIVVAEARKRLDDSGMVAAKAAATIMAMNTVYYGAVNLLHNRDYRSEPPRLSMLAMANPRAEKIDFELWALAVSALTNCQSCLNVHEAELHKRGTSLETVQTALRIASVMNAVAVVLRAELSQVA